MARALGLSLHTVLALLASNIIKSQLQHAECEAGKYTQLWQHTVAA